MAKPSIHPQQPIFLLPLVFLSVTDKSPFSTPYLHFEQVHLPATMSAPLLYTIKNNNQNQLFKSKESSGRCRG